MERLFQGNTPKRSFLPRHCFEIGWCLDPGRVPFQFQARFLTQLEDLTAADAG